MILLYWLSVLTLSAPPPSDQVTPRPGELFEQPLEAGQSHVHDIELTPGPWRLEVDQQDIDVMVEVSNPAGESLLSVDSPFDRQGLETALVEVNTAGVHRVTVRSREPTATGGRYTIRIDQLPPDPRRLAAERAMTEASRLYLEGTSDAWRKALDAYTQALEAFRALGEEPAAARALYASAVVQRLVQENARALEQSREVLMLFRRLEDRVFLANTVNEIGLNQWLLGETAKARLSFGRALELQRQAGHRWGEAVASANLCLMDLVEGDLRAGAECYEDAVPLLIEVQATDLAASALTNAGRALDLMGEPDKALDTYNEALEQVRVLGDRTKEARVLNNLGVLRRELGQLQEAFVSYGEALAIFQESGNRRWMARVQGNIGLAYGKLGRLGQARAHFRQALSLWGEVGDPRGEASILSHLGWAHREHGEPREALAYFERALALWRAAGDRRQEARALKNLGRNYLKLSDPVAAVGLLAEAVTLFQELGDRIGETDALLYQGSTFGALDRPRDALESLNRALELARDIGSRSLETWSLLFLARSESRASRLPSADRSHAARARAHIEAAIEIVESDRHLIRPPTLRASYASGFHEFYELYVDLLMEAHRGAPEAGYDLAALEVTERARARTLLDLLEESGADVHEGVDPELLERRKSLRRRLEAKAERASRGSVDAARRGVLEAEQSAILRQLDLVEARLRKLPTRGASSRSRPATVAEIRSLLGDDTGLLVFSLGEDRSFLWLVTSDAVRVHELPARREIEEAARRVHESLRHFAAADKRRDAEHFATLGRLLLGPVADLKGVQRLVVVPDGALYYVPFEALLLPDSAAGSANSRTVLETYEVVYLPSASVLAAQRRAAASRPPAPGVLAVLADPVFDRRDPRLAGTTTEDQGPGLLRDHLDGVRFERLPATHKEAEALATLAPPGEVLAAFGFAANRQRVLGDRLRPYRFIHFATHGVIDSETPALSGLALSLYDAEGRAREGFLRLHDIYGLRLGAELVVLSGCRTALGTQMRGEGLWGLTQGFLSAGAKRVLASLWQVEDRATAELMRRFYHALWREGLPPATALRRAKLSLSQERRWRDPYFWAGFVLEGDWR